MDVSWMHSDENSVPSVPVEVQRVLQHSEFRPHPFTTAATERLLDTCRFLFLPEHVRLAAFEVVGPGLSLGDASPDLDEQPPVAEALLRSPGFARAVPDLVVGRRLSPPRFATASTLLLDGTLAQVLQEGGPRQRFRGSGADARAIATAFCADLFADRYDDVRVEHSVAPWSTWFEGVAWDHTWVVMDLREQRLTVLCLTDGD